MKQLTDEVFEQVINELRVASVAHNMLQAFGHKKYTDYVITTLTAAQQAQPEPTDTRVHLAGPDTPVYYVLHADGVYSEASPQPAQPERAASADAGRIDWLEQYCCDVARRSSTALHISWNNGVSTVIVGPNNHATWRDAIDAAIKQGGQQAKQAQPERGPLTQTQVVEAFCELKHNTQYVSVFDAGVRYAERYHGIKQGGQQ